MYYCDKINIALNLIGYNNNKNKNINKKPIYCYFGLKLIILISCLLYLINNWDYLDRRINSLKSITLYMIFLFYCIIYLTCSKHIKSTVSIIINNDTEEKYPFIITNNRINLLKLNKKEILLQHNFLYYLFSFNAIILCILPLFGTIYIILNSKNLNSIKIEKLPLFYPVYYNSNVKSIYIYFIWYTLQSIYILYNCAIAYLTYSVSVLSMKTVVNDIKLLCLSIKEIDNNIITLIENNKSIKKYDNKTIREDVINYLPTYNDNINNYENNNYLSKNEFTLKMKNYLKFIINDHQIIYR